MPAHLQADQVNFRFFVGAAKEEPVISDSKLMDAIGKQNKHIGFSGSGTFFRLSSGIAAALLIMFGFYFFLGRGTGTPQHKVLTQDQQLAYVQTKKALLLISSKLNKGNEQVTRISKFNDVENLLTNKN